MSDVIDVGDENWEKVVEKNEKLVMVMFSSPTCPYCKQMKPYFEAYASKFKEKVVFAEVNIAKTPTIMSRYGIMGTPTFKLFCAGHPIQELTGSIDPTILKKVVEEGMNQGMSCIEKTSWIDPGYA